MNETYEVGQKVIGFTCIDKKEISELNGTLYEFVHDKTKAKMIYMATSDRNKLFSVAFKTTPENDTGVFHILEHSVLCGSKKFPVKEPFVELMKSSMNTFLNAMTFSDKTMYPVSSRNEKDFLNLTEVYLDAVFAPAIYENDNIFRQEGWHYELRDKNEEASIKGVVFNEMKGTEADVNRLITNEMMRILYKDSCYYYISGGASEAIPQLTYEEFLDNHRKYYHPTNAIFYLEGDMDITKPVALMEEYLKDKDCLKDKIEIANPAVAPACETVKEYPVSPEEDLKNKTQVVFGKLLWDFSKKNELYAAMLLTSYLTESNESPLKKLILEKGLGQDVTLSVEDGIKQSFLKLKISNTEQEKSAQIKKEVLALVQKLAQEGLDKKILEAALNQIEFMCREIEEPRGLYHNIRVLDSYLYGGAPELFLTFDDTFAFLREQLKTDYFEKLLLEMFDEKALVTLVMVPSPTLSRRREEDETKRVAAVQKSWSDDEVADILAMNAKLDAWQQTEDTREQLSTMPTLSISDVDELPEENVTKEMEMDGVKVLVHPTDVANITYISLYFPIPKKFEENISEIAMLTELLMELRTRERELLEVLQDVKMNLGRLDFEVAPYAKENETETCTAYLVVKCSVLKKNISHAVRLIKEIALQTDFSSKEDVKNYLLQMQQLFRQNIIGNGHRIGMKKCASSYSVQNTISEKIDGVTCYGQLKSLIADFDARYTDFAALMESIAEECFNRNQMIVSIAAHTADTEKADFLEEYKVSDIISIFPDNGKKDVEMTCRMKKEDCTFVAIPSAVSYAEASSNLNALKDGYKGSWRVATKILSLAHLWNAVRVQGGAYGVGLAVGPAANLTYYSYRDPNGARSLDKYKESAEFLRNFVNSGQSFENFIIGSVADVEPLLSPREKAEVADIEWLRKTGYPFNCRIRRELLHLTKEELLTCADILEKMWGDVSICVVGAEDKDLKVTEKVEL